MSPTDIFAIVVLIAAILIITYLVISAIYFNNLINLQTPSRGESSFLFWTSLILAIFFVGIGIYAIIRIFTYKAYVPSVVKAAPVAAPVVAPPRRLSPVVRPTESVVPRYAPLSDVSTNLSDLPVSSRERTAITSSLLANQEAMN
jgi:hypothetical protein